ncbi:hypothetical protein [Carboxylicivirga sp. M1479]|uniref:hypothetical protein n=1 Tax=Carboxylicivirga sp. M1479 TaxID=2594476 RepID=UPI001177BB8C|nr:hypothetical protein [Carboxylicivirga sp. M1479]TRX71400.1 hypothetical protein FNN09_06430 [Carboxylicivirga sp. M1479]
MKRHNLLVLNSDDHIDQALMQMDISFKNVQSVDDLLEEMPDVIIADGEMARRGRFRSTTKSTNRFRSYSNSHLRQQYF